MVSRFTDTTFTLETHPAFNLETNDKVQIDGNGRHNHSVNNMATRNVHSGLNSIFSGNIFEGTFNI